MHDFSAPRQSRNLSYNDSTGPWNQLNDSGRQSSNGVPFIPLFQDDGSPSAVSDGSPRRSLHTPIFKEHLSEDSAQAGAGAIQAERLENKAFLNRASQISQDSAALPPFARRSQPIDCAVSKKYNAGVTSGTRGDHDPRTSTSSSDISPIAQRYSTLPGPNNAPRESVSPVSPATSDKLGGTPFSNPVSRPISESDRHDLVEVGKPFRLSDISKTCASAGIAPPSAMASTLDMTDSDTGGAGARSNIVQPTVGAIAEEQIPKSGDNFITLPERTSPSTPQGDLDLASIPPQTSSTRSPSIQPSLTTSDPENIETMTPTKTPPKLAQKRSDAVGHTKRMSSGGNPKHRVSNASRFSFQLGGSNTEEQALEEKGRRLTMLSGSESAPKADVDDDDYFDEDAMDDMDEMEAQAQEDYEAIPGAEEFPNRGFEAQHTPTFMPMSDARQQLQLDNDSDAESEFGLGDERRRSRYSAFGSNVHTRNSSGIDPTASAAIHRRKISDETKLTLNTNFGPNGDTFIQDDYAADSGARSGFYMQPAAAGYSPTRTNRNILSQQSATYPPMPHRNSRNSERNRPGSDFQPGSQADAKTSNGQYKLSSSTQSSVDETANRSLDRSGVQSGAPLQAPNELGLSGFSGFKFIDSPQVSRPISLESAQRYRPVGADRSRGDSETLPQHATFVDTRSAKPSPSPQQNMTSAQDLYRDDQFDLDDMYFDDGGFESDVNNRSLVGETVDEDAFDDDDFLRKPNGVGDAVHPVHQHDSSDLGGYGLDTGGPYPTFVAPKSTRLKQEKSHLQLDDLPLYEQTSDPKLVPRRNPSEDAKRFGSGSRVPQTSQQGRTVGTAAGLQANLQSYHAALAEAANKAASDGRFSRMPSTSTTRNGVNPSGQGDDEFKMPPSDDLSRSTLNGYVNATAPDNNSDPEERGARGIFHATTDRIAVSHSPSNMTFDFGFDSGPIDDSIMDDDFDLMGDDDIVAAANAEALANDDEGFYGQEFGFYAKARPNSAEVEAINGGFFGLEGDDGLARQKSLKEPNLTPITERSEFSTRNSFIGMGQFGPPSAGPFSSHYQSNSRRLSAVSPWIENEVTTFDQLRKLKASAFGGSNISLHSDGSGQGLHTYSGSAPVSARSSAAAQGYFGPLGGAPMTFGYSTDSSGSSNPTSAHAYHGQPLHDSPHSATSSSHLPFSMDLDATPKRPLVPVDTPMTARKVSDKPARGHSRNSSGADSVTYVREQDPDGNGPPRWVLEKRRTSEQGQSELVAREVVQDGWI